MCFDTVNIAVLRVRQSLQVTVLECIRASCERAEPNPKFTNIAEVLECLPDQSSRTVGAVVSGLWRCRRLESQVFHYHQNSLHIVTWFFRNMR